MQGFCSNCGNKESYSWKIYLDDNGSKVELCHKCHKPTPLGDHFITRNAFRTRWQRDHFAKDLIQPFLKNKPNPEFAKAYPERAADNYTQKELNELGCKEITSRKEDEIK